MDGRCEPESARQQHPVGENGRAAKYRSLTIVARRTPFSLLARQLALPPVPLGSSLRRCSRLVAPVQLLPLASSHHWYDSFPRQVPCRQRSKYYGPKPRTPSPRPRQHTYGNRRRHSCKQSKTSSTVTMRPSWLRTRSPGSRSCAATQPVPHT
jgi:hypothetical protein